MNPLFSNQKQDWATPEKLFNQIAASYGPFDLDVCASEENTKCEYFYDADQDSLSDKCKWTGVCWCNPPYGREIKKWVKKAVESVQSKTAKRVVFLIPSRTDASWWHEYIIPYAKDVIFIRGRVKFIGAKHNAPFPSSIIIFE